MRPQGWWILRTLLVGAVIMAPLAGSVAMAASSSATSNMVQQGVSYFNRGYIKKAIPIFEKAVQGAPNDEMANLWLARAYKQQGGPEFFQKAVEYFEKVLAVNPNNFEALTAAAEVLSWNPTTRNRSLDYYRRAVQLQPANAQIAKQLAEVLSWEQKVQESLMYAEPVAEQYKNDKKWMSMYASMLARSNRAEEAVSVYENILGEDPSADPTVKEAYAVALTRAGRKEQALEVYNKLKAEAEGESAEQNYERRLSLASTAYEMGLYEDALKWDQSVPPALLNERIEIEMRMARTYAKLNRSPDAMALFHKLYTAGRMDMKNKLEYADYLSDLQLPDASLPEPGLIEMIYRDALMADANNVETALRLARFYGRDPNRFQDAAALFMQAMTVDTTGRAKTELIDFLKSSSNFPNAPVEQVFLALTDQYPADADLWGAYAEYLSWDDPSRPKALDILYTLATRLDTANQDKWLKMMDQVLSWHVPKLEYLPLYEKLATVLPNSKALWLGVGRAYANNVPEHYMDAVKVYQSLMERFPDDDTVKSEWASLITSDKDNRKEAMATLKDLVEKKPEDVTLRVAYGRVLSYEGFYKDSIRHYDFVLERYPENRDALLGKGHALLWDDQKLRAKGVLKKARKLFPRDVEVLMALAEAEKGIGRYDHAFSLLQEVKKLLKESDLKEHTQAENPYAWLAALPQVTDYLTLPASPQKTGWEAVQYTGNRSGNAPVQDFMLIPYDAAPKAAPTPKAPAYTQPTYTAPAPVVVGPRPIQPQRIPAPTEASTYKPALTPQLNQDLQKLQADMDRLDKTLQTMSVLQKDSDNTLHTLHESFTDRTSVGASNAVRMTGASSTPAMPGGLEDQSLLGSSTPYSSYSQTSSLLDEDFSLLSGRGKMYYDRAIAIEDAMEYAMRPELRAGYLLSTQEGEPTTSDYRHFSFPNQLSMSLTPQVRLRGGIVPRKTYIPDSPVGPRVNWGTQYTWGTTIKPLDRLTLDGDMAITHFYQTDDNDLTYQVSGKFDITDRIHWTVGGRRTPIEQSLLSYAGFRPSNGPWSGLLLGQAREHGVFTELNMVPFKNWDLNLGYEWMGIGGHRIASNHKNQFFGSLGYTHNYLKDHYWRLGYQFLYFDYGRYATTGFFDTVGTNPGPVVTLFPTVFSANPGTRFGGYFSPDWFVLNSFRLDLRGSFLKRKIEYRLGGSLGVQAFDNGNVADPSPTSMASSFDVLLMLNLTKWLSLYGTTDYLDAGGQFNRWRFGGGAIIRPNIPALSPLFGGN